MEQQQPNRNDPTDLEAFSSLLKAGARTPAATFVAVSLAFSLGVQLALGFVVAIASTGSSFIDLGDNSSLIKETFHQAAAFTQASLRSQDFGGFDIATTPLLFSLFPAGSIWFSFRLFGKRQAALDETTSFLSAGALCILFAGGVAVFAMIGGEISSDGVALGFSEGQVFLLGLFWALLGAVAGNASQVANQLGKVLPAQAKGAARLASIGLRPLAVLLLVSMAIGVVAWETQVIRDVGKAEGTFSVRGDRSAVGAVAETALYSADIGVHFASLGAMSAFHNRLYPIGLAFPVTKVAEVTGVGEDNFEDVQTEEAAVSAVFETPGTYRVWDYSGALPTWAYLGLLGLIPMVLVFWAYAGFTTARQGRPDSPLAAALLGTLIGPATGLTMLVLNALTQNFVYGDGDGGSVFLMFTFGAAVVGGLGGLLATRVTTGEEHAEPSSAVPGSG